MADTTSHSGTWGPGIPSAKIDPEYIAEVREAQLMVPLCDFRPLSPGGGLALSFPRLTTTVSLTAITSGANEGDAQSTTALSLAVATATAAQKAAFVVGTWLSQFGSAINMRAALPQILGRAAADLIDVDFAALLAGGSNTVGSTGINQTLDDLRSAGTTLRRLYKNGADMGVFVLHPQQVDDVDSALLSGSGPGLSPLMSRSDVINWYGAVPGSAFLSAYRGHLFGLPVMTSTNVPDMNSSADHGGALFIPKVAFGGVYAWLPTPIFDTQTVNFKLSDSFGISCAYGVVEKFDTAIVTVVGDHV